MLRAAQFDLCVALHGRPAGTLALLTNAIGFLVIMLVDIDMVRELGIMEIDESGLWVDFSLDQWQGETEDACPLPPALPADWLEKAGIGPEDLDPPPPMQSDSRSAAAPSALDSATNTGKAIEPRRFAPSPAAPPPARLTDKIQPAAYFSPLSPAQGVEAPAAGITPESEPRRLPVVQGPNGR